MFLRFIAQTQGKQAATRRSPRSAARGDFRWGNLDFTDLEACAEQLAQTFDKPITGISFHDARAYCHWLNIEQGARSSLTERNRVGKSGPRVFGHTLGLGRYLVSSAQPITLTLRHPILQALDLNGHPVAEPILATAFCEGKVYKMIRFKRV